MQNRHIQIYKLIMYQGSLELILGPMFSGKTTQLLRKLHRFEHAQKKCLAVSYAKDNRYSLQSQIISHDNQKRKAIKVTQLKQILSIVDNYHVVAIDQGQFFLQIVDIVQKLANSGKIVIVAALDGTYQRKPFNNILNLVPLAEKVYKLSAVCMQCKNREAHFSHRIVESKEIQLIGGAEKYKALCRKCYMEFNNSGSTKQDSEGNQITLYKEKVVQR